MDPREFAMASASGKQGGAPKTRPASLEPATFPLPGFDIELVAEEALRAQPGKVDRARLLAWLQDGREFVRVNALRMLALDGELGEGELMTVVVLMRDQSPLVRSAAAYALRATTDLAKAVPALASSSSDADARVREAVSLTIRAYGERSLTHLTACLDMEPDVAERTVLKHFIAFGEAGRKRLVDATRAPQENVRASALAGLSLMGLPALVASREAIAPLLRDKSEVVRRLAKDASGQILRKGVPQFAEPKVLPIEGFDAKNLDVDIVAKHAKKLVLEDMLAFVTDGREVVRANAWRCIVAIGKMSHTASQLAALALKDGEAEVRRSAARALSIASDDELDYVVTPLVAASLDRDEVVKKSARDTLAGYGKRALPQLIAGLGSQDDELGQRMAWQIGALGKEAVPALTSALGSSRPLVREQALRALRHIGGDGLDSALKAILPLLCDPHDPCRLHATRCIASMSPKKLKGNKELEAALQRLETDDPIATVRAGAMAALEVLYSA